VKTFFTPSVNHLEPFINTERGLYKIRKFNDGEMLVRLEDHVEKQPVTIIAATHPPAKHFCELFLLLDTLKQQEARVHLILTYFGYGRQDHPKPNVARAAHVISQCLKQFDIDKITVIHPHSVQLQQEVPCERFIPFNLYKPLIKKLAIDTIVSPDNGGALACQELAQQTQCLLGVISKERMNNDQIIAGQADLPPQIQRVLIFDDIVSTGSTIIQAANILKEHGATHIYAAVTHCFMNEVALQKVIDSPIQHLWVSNSVPVYLNSSHTTVINLAPEIEHLVNQSTMIP